MVTWHFPNDCIFLQFFLDILNILRVVDVPKKKIELPVLSIYQILFKNHGAFTISDELFVKNTPILRMPQRLRQECNLTYLKKSREF